MGEPTLMKIGKLIPQKWDDPNYINSIRPLDHIMNWFGERIPKQFGEKSKYKFSLPRDRILIVRSETGSGKSTVQITELFHRFHKAVKKNIVITEPRVVNAQSIANDILIYNSRKKLDEMGFPNREELIMGKNVGYQTGSIVKKPINGIVYSTVGTLLQQFKMLTDEEFMSRYMIIVIDEVHQRSTDSDLLMFMMKKFIGRNYANPNCPFLLLTSATFDVPKFIAYFDAGQNFIEVIGTSQDIQDNFLEYDSDDYAESCAAIVAQIHAQTEDFLQPSSPDVRDILIFVSGSPMARRINDALDKIIATKEIFKKYPIMKINLTREIVARQTSEYHNIFSSYNEIFVEIGKKHFHPVRRIIISTNVAETGVTIPSLKYVIDSGFQNALEFNPNFGVKFLIKKPITRSMARQRRGRTGRLAPGIFYALYTKKTFDLMMIDQYPEVVLTDITEFFLDVISYESEVPNMSDLKKYVDTFSSWTIGKKSFDLKELDLMDFPPIDSVKYSIEKMYVLGFIDSNSSLTKLGLLASKFRMINLESRKMILSGYAWDCSIADLVTIAAFLTLRKNDLIPNQLMSAYLKSIDKGHFSFGIGKTDYYVSTYDDEIIRLLAIYNEFSFVVQSGKRTFSTSTYSIEKWCERVGIDFEVFLTVISLRNEIMESMAAIGLNPYYNYEYSIHKYPTKEQIKKLKLCIYEGYKLNLVIKKDDGIYTSWRNNTQINIKHHATYLVTSGIMYGLEGDIYVPNKLGFISSMDGFVNIDEDYLFDF